MFLDPQSVVAFNVPQALELARIAAKHKANITIADTARFAFARHIAPQLIAEEFARGGRA